VTWDLILRRLDAASTEQEANEAAKTFRWWAGAGRIAALEIPCPFAKSLPKSGLPVAMPAFASAGTSLFSSAGQGTYAPVAPCR